MEEKRTRVHFDTVNRTVQSIRLRGRSGKVIAATREYLRFIIIAVHHYNPKNLSYFCRRKLKDLCLDLLKDVEMETIKPIIELYFMLQTNLNESISKITELINDLLYPNNPTAEETAALERQEQTGGQRITETNDTQKQNIKFKVRASFLRHGCFANRFRCY